MWIPININEEIKVLVCAECFRSSCAGHLGTLRRSFNNGSKLGVKHKGKNTTPARGHVAFVGLTCVYCVQVEQLFCLGLSSRAECLKLLEMSEWNLEVASTQMLDNYGSVARQRYRYSLEFQPGITTLIVLEVSQ